MSKYFKILVAALAAVALAAPAFAITGDISGFLQVRGVAADNMNGRDEVDDNTRAVDQRFRLWTKAALNEDVKAVFAVEVDNVWGQTGNAGLQSTEGNGKEVGAIGADAKGQIEIKHVYLDFNIPELNANVKAGTQYFKLGGGLIIAEDATGMQVRIACPAVKGNNLGLYWVKAVEGAAANDDEDLDYYQINYDIPAGDWHFTPYVGYLDQDDAGTAEGNEQFYYGLDVKGKLADLDLKGTFVLNDGNIGADDNGAFAFLVGAGYKVGATKLSLEVAKYGDKDNGGTFKAVKGYNNFAEVITGGKFDGRTAAGGTASTTVSSAAGAPYYLNYQYVKVGAQHQLNDKTKLSGAYIFAEEAEDTTTHDAITFGHEIDAYVDYTIVKGLTFTVGGGYLIADDDYGQTAGGGAANTAVGGDDAWKVGSALTYKF